MRTAIDIKQDKTIARIGLLLTFVSVAVAVLVYMENKKHSKIKEDTNKLDREIKALELALKQKEAKQNGII